MPTFLPETGHIGQMRHRVKVIEKTKTGTDSGGHAQYTRSTLATIWAFVDAGTPGDEPTNAEQQQPRNTYAITTRYGVTITPATELEWDGLTLNVVSVSPSLRKTRLWITARQAA